MLYLWISNNLYHYLIQCGWLRCWPLVSKSCRICLVQCVQLWIVLDRIRSGNNIRNLFLSYDYHANKRFNNLADATNCTNFIIAEDVLYHQSYTLDPCQNQRCCIWTLCSICLCCYHSTMCHLSGKKNLFLVLLKD